MEDKTPCWEQAKKATESILGYTDEAIDAQCDPDGDKPCFSRDTYVCRVYDPSNLAKAFGHCFEGKHSPDAAELVLMTSVRAGDHVLSNAGMATNVIVNQHVHADIISNIVELHHSRGVLSLTPDHVLQVDGKFAPAKTVQIGSALTSASGETFTVERVVARRGSIINPITAQGKILAISGDCGDGSCGAPVIASTANEWLADVLLSSYPRYTMSFNLATLFPAHTQAYYDALLELVFTDSVPTLEYVASNTPFFVTLAGVAIGDAFLAVGLVVFVLLNSFAAWMTMALAIFVYRKATACCK